MADTRSPPGKAVGTALVTVFTAPAPGVATIVLVNIDGSASVVVNECSWVDVSDTSAGAGGTPNAIIAPGYSISARDTVERDKFMDTGDFLQVRMSADGDTRCTVDFLVDPT